MKSKSMDAELELKNDAILGECPVWDDLEVKIFLIEFLSGRL